MECNAGVSKMVADKTCSEFDEMQTVCYKHVSNMQSLMSDALKMTESDQTRVLE